MLQSRSYVTRMISIAVAVVFLLVSLLASTQSASAASKFKVTVTKKTIVAGQTVKFGSNRNVKWSVSNKKVAKLTAVKKRTATLKGLKAGTVYVKAKYGKTTKKIKIVVKNGPRKINLLTTKDTIGVSEVCSVFVHSVVPASASEAVIYSSSDEKIAIVDSMGHVTGISKGYATIKATSKVNNITKAEVTIKVVPANTGTVTLDVELTDPERYPAGETAKVWLPVPQSDDYQTISDISFSAPGAKVAKLKKDSAGGKQLYIEWDEETMPDDRKATLSYFIFRRAVVRDDYISSIKTTVEDVDQVAFDQYLTETYWSGNFDSGIVKERADRIVADAGAKTVYEKAHAIYDWMCNNLIRTDDKTVIFGDVVSILKGYEGKEGGRNAGSCMDMNSVFVALCRAEGIPARNLFGLRFTSGGPNCRAEFYLPDYGWVPADPAMAIKWGRGLDAGPKLDSDADWEEKKDEYWGNGEENWICLNMGRDIVLDPPQSIATKEYLEVLNPVNEQGISTINLYMFPYGEYGDQYIEGQKRDEFRYKYSYDGIEDPLDCGC